MRRVARELGAGTMTLYHYVRTKDELIDLMDDAIMGEVLIPDGEMPDTLARGAARDRAQLARRVRAPPVGARRRSDGARGGPNGMRHFEQSLAAVASLDLDVRAKLELIAIVDDYVFGFVFRSSAVSAALSSATRTRRSSMSSCRTSRPRSAAASTRTSRRSSATATCARPGSSWSTR